MMMNTYGSDGNPRQTETSSRNHKLEFLSFEARVEGRDANQFQIEQHSYAKQNMNTCMHRRRRLSYEVHSSLPFHSHLFICFQHMNKNGTTTQIGAVAGRFFAIITTGSRLMMLCFCLSLWRFIRHCY